LFAIPQYLLTNPRREPAWVRGLEVPEVEKASLTQIHREPLWHLKLKDYFPPGPEETASVLLLQ
jgi:hypothetical protein